ncbi:hypothetical protein HU200_014338 [Digitaria exilis]|uniref:BAG domain-containing protein n=1 Tax=Digitaria exilis TaxID=1010633 RepID=A0A835KLL8_9POAL|nr:hypothetical protein HU200_014338 [Digitaria exilis]
MPNACCRLERKPHCETTLPQSPKSHPRSTAIQEKPTNIVGCYARGGDALPRVLLPLRRLRLRPLRPQPRRPVLRPPSFLLPAAAHHRVRPPPLQRPVLPRREQSRHGIPLHRRLLAEVVQMLRAAANRKPPRPRPLSIPINIRGLDAAAEPETEPADRTTEVLTPAAALVAAEKQKGGPSVEEEAAVRVQAAARGFLARRSVRAVRRVEREAAAVGRIVAEKAAALRENGRARLAAGEVLMKMLLRLDAVRGAREYRRQVTRRLLALQDAVHALDPMAAPPSPEAGAHEAEPEAEVNEERETSPGDTFIDVCEPQDSDAEGEWEMVAEESADAPPRQEPPEQEVTTAAEAGAPGGVDTAGLAEMVAALCERSAQQSDVLERAVRQTEKETHLSGHPLENLVSITRRHFGANLPQNSKEHISKIDPYSRGSWPGIQLQVSRRLTPCANSVRSRCASMQHLGVESPGLTASSTGEARKHDYVDFDCSTNATTPLLFMSGFIDDRHGESNNSSGCSACQRRSLGFHARALTPRRHSGSFFYKNPDHDD